MEAKRIEWFIQPVNGRLVASKAVRLTWFQRLQRWLGF